MNIKLVSVLAALAVSAAVAQDYDDDEDEMDSSTETSQNEEGSTREEAPAAPSISDNESAFSRSEEKTSAAPIVAAKGLNVLHGNAYNLVENQAAASTIGGDMFYLYNMAGRTMLYVEPTNEAGILSLARGETTFLAGFDNSGNTGLLTAGIASNSFGVALRLSLDKAWNSDEVGNSKNNASTTGIGDDIGAIFSLPLGELDFAVQADWFTYANDVDTDNGTEIDQSKWELIINAEVSNSPSAKDIFWAGGLTFNRHADSQESGSNEMVNPNARLSITPRFNLGMPVVGSEDARILVGLNTYIPIVFYDGIEDKNAQVEDSYSTFGLHTVPNIFGEYAISENWIIYGGASFDWKIFGYAGEEIETKAPGGNTEELSSITMKTDRTNANAGIRFQYNRLVLEASVADNLGSSSWSGLIGNFAAFINF